MKKKTKTKMNKTKLKLKIAGTRVPHTEISFTFKLIESDSVLFWTQFLWQDWLDHHIPDSGVWNCMCMAHQV